jgi:hypothetical protein
MAFFAAVLRIENPNQSEVFTVQILTPGEDLSKQERKE